MVVLIDPPMRVVVLRSDRLRMDILSLLVQRRARASSGFLARTFDVHSHIRVSLMEQ